jgi:hypothetical protein
MTREKWTSTNDSYAIENEDNRMGCLIRVNILCVTPDGVFRENCSSRNMNSFVSLSLFLRVGYVPSVARGPLGELSSVERSPILASMPV